MSLLRIHGYAEAEVRAHSPGWAQAQWDAITRRRKLELADDAVTAAHATAAGTGSYEGAGSDLEELIQSLRIDVDESTEWLLNPNAKTDLEAMRGMGPQMGMAVK